MGLATASEALAAGAPNLRVRARGEAAKAPAESYALAWDNEPPPPFAPGAQRATLGGADPAFAAQIWLDQGPQGLRIGVEVTDAQHDNARADADIWDGDAVQLNLHPLGADEELRAGTLETGGAGDLLLSLALSSGRPSGWVHQAPAEATVGPWRGPLAITRDEAQRRTRYLTTVPWEALGAGAGSLTAVGLSVWVLDGGRAKGPGGPRVPPRRLRLGASAAGGVRPCEMAELHLAPPSGAFVALGRPEVREIAGREQLVLPLQAALPPGAGPLSVGVHCGARTFALAGLSTRLRHLLYVNVADVCGAQKVHVALYNKRGVALTQLTTDVIHAAGKVAAADRAVANAELEADASGDAFAAADARAAQALLRLLVAQAAAAKLTAPRDEIVQLAAVARALARRYAEPAGLRRALATGEVPAFGTLTAAGDQSLQPYLLSRPTQGAPDGARRPLLVWLHGRGDPRLTNFVEQVAAAGLRARPGTVRALPNSYLLVPWTRGNLGARGLGGEDVLQALAQVQAEHGVDAERVSLAGFSLGGSGAFDLAVHAPEPWAAVATFSAGAWQVGMGHRVGENAASFPVLSWHGDADGAVDVDNLRRIRRELGANVEVHVVEGGGHVFGEVQWQALQAFLVGKKRITSPAWRYTADTANFRRRRGVWLDVDAARTPFPSVHVRVERAGAGALGTTVRVDSDGTAGLELDLGPAGLDVRGEVTVLYRGRQVWRGPPTRLTLGRGAARP